jgi:electron transport complex protein RnfB
MHVVIDEWCTGCDLCIPPCPVDCITMVPVTGKATGWDAWSQELADLARNRYESREKRLEREELDNVRRLALKAKNKAKALDLESAKTEDEKSEIERKRAIIAAAMARAQEKLQSSS